MKQIFHFDQLPPPLTEKMLRAELERRRSRRQTGLLTVAAVLMEACLWAAALLLFPTYPVLSLLCLLYSAVSITGGTILILIFTYKRKELLL